MIPCLKINIFEECFKISLCIGENKNAIQFRHFFLIIFFLVPLSVTSHLYVICTLLLYYMLCTLLLLNVMRSISDLLTLPRMRPSGHMPVHLEPCRGWMLCFSSLINMNVYLYFSLLQHPYVPVSVHHSGDSEVFPSV